MEYGVYMFIIILNLPLFDIITSLIQKIGLNPYFLGVRYESSTIGQKNVR